MYLDGKSTVCCGTAKDVWVAHSDVLKSVRKTQIALELAYGRCQCIWLCVKRWVIVSYLPVSFQMVRVDRRWLYSEPRGTRNNFVRDVADSAMASNILRRV
jgi:hypothetical protein